MAKSGPIILVEDDSDDHEIFIEVLEQIGEYDVKWFPDCIKCLEYLKTTEDDPFIIFCDINIPLMSGIEFKLKIDENPMLRDKSIPFIFYTTSDDDYFVNMAYKQMTIQGFFKKRNDYSAIKETLECIINYWDRCRHPNSDLN